MVLILGARLVWVSMHAPGGLGSAELTPVDRLWRQMFSNGRQTSVVIADGSITIVQNLLHRPLRLGEYQGQGTRAALDNGVKDPKEHALGVEILWGYFTSISDVTVARKVAVLNARHELATDFVFARNFDARQAASHNLILAGSRRANPWLGLFEDRLNFQSEFEEEPRRAYFRNRNPAPGEQATYEVQWEVRGYCRVAYLQGLDTNTSVLILSGTDMASSEAGIQFVTSDDGVKQIRSALGLRDTGRVPYFEALLGTDLVASSAPRSTLVVMRKRP